MCGIAGYFQFNGESVSPVLLRRMGDAIAHRGPDGEGLFSDGPCGLVHRRLAIIDLSPAGHQPMSTEDGRYVLSYNGEIFNFQELRIQLEALGWQFHSRTDSEVVLKALAQWGIDALARFNGQFAFALWDCRKRRLLIGRDRYGIKPVYVCRTARALVFGSEIKALLRHPECHTAIDKEGLFEYLSFQNFFTDRTLFKGVSILPAGSWLSVVETGEQQTGTYWDFNFSEPDSISCNSDSEYREELDRLLRQAVKRQLVADVEVGTYLSGGMDSGTITALAARELPNMRTFTCGFDLRSASGMELGMDERENAEYMAYLYKTEHYQMVLKAGDMQQVLPKLTWHLEEPRVGQSYPNFYVAQLASKFCKVVLSGDGGDELFAGYPWRYYRAVVNDDFRHYIDKYHMYWQRLLPADCVSKIFAPIWPDVSHVSTRDIFCGVFHEHAHQLTRPEDYINHSLYFEAKTFLHGLLTVEDKISMAHGLETRVPFLDNDLVDFAMKVPVKCKLGNLGEVVRLDENEPGPKTSKYFHKTRDGKLLLRRVMERYVPEEIADGVKKGFSAPDASWFRGESIDYVRSSLMGSNAHIFNYLDRETVQSIINDHLDGKENRRLLIWSLLTIEEWMKHMEANTWNSH
ncbi:asparagine synthase (glutamine-hydrolyzing) [Synechococcus sp. HJ21-Hayes]|uniref:asparagine synthase (glutamine-hydrolyzing) n=1 Tax=unclassified Synechococcus TaxID=2626047 RepID=UPI0020CC02CF|nr:MULTISPECIES: asparagine synthase (glutamine-hydrolyzing) [unclassified Synechococcus]MCP9830074.1 asparagine synthase (glutamine-hydrolyzing) [Synechococcus sp. JJ3a-Johnson]MCP9852118.1 asparagine synthase (glutamine-hydrolyzing) [Synechococcus sp. HJ21-Hayes]